MEASADFVTEVPMVMFVPPFITIVMVIWFLVWTFLAAYVFSLGIFEPTPGGAVPWGTVTRTDFEFYQCWYFFFGFLWITAFIDAVN